MESRQAARAKLDGGDQVPGRMDDSPEKTGVTENLELLIPAHGVPAVQVKWEMLDQKPLALT